MRGTSQLFPRLVAILGSVLLSISDVLAKRALTVAESIETARMLSARADDGTMNEIFISPDGKRYVVMLVHGDLVRNEVLVDVMTATLGSLEEASRLLKVGTLSTQGFGTPFTNGQSALTASGFNQVKWLADNERVAFFWEDASHVNQVVTLNVRTGEQRFLTRETAEVTQFEFGPNGELVYTARVPNDLQLSEALKEGGFVVTSPDAFSLLQGEVGDRGGFERKFSTRRFIVKADSAQRSQIVIPGREYNRWVSSVAVFSPDAQYLLVDGTPPEIPASWNHYTHEHARRILEDYKANYPRDTLGRQLSQLFIVDVGNGQVRPLWNVPSVPAFRNAIWSLDGKSVVLAPAFLPTGQADTAGLAGTVMVEINVKTGQVWRIPIDPKLIAAGVTSLRWDGPDVLQVTCSEGEMFAFRKMADRWQPWTGPQTNLAASARVQIEVREDLNTPPVLFAVEPQTGREKRIRDLNPKLRNVTLGKVASVQWTDPAGRQWSGLLYYPVSYSPKRHFPLVIQTHGHAMPSKFSLYGKGPLAPGLGPGYSVYVAQALANRNIAVLQMEDKRLAGVSVSPKEPEMYMAAYKAAVDYLANTGLVDRAKVGLSGYSRTGWHVEHTLAHSDVDYAAAIVSDNFSASYVETALAGWNHEDTLDVGAAPFGDGLRTWLDRSPAFNAHRVRTPLRMQVESGGVPGAILKWEMFSRLRHLGKPAELYVIPEGDKGSHGLQNPRQCLASQQGAVDWFDFWLNGYEDPDVRKAEQYARWRMLRHLHEAGK